MKYLALLLLISCEASGQKKFVRPKPLKDSTWIEQQADTLFGTVQYSVGNGKVVGDGILVTTKFVHHSQYIYTEKDQRRIDSFLRAQPFFAFDGGYSMSDENRTRAYIKTDKGYRYVIEQFTFTPVKQSNSYVFDLLNKILSLIPPK